MRYVTAGRPASYLIARVSAALVGGRVQAFRFLMALCVLGTPTASGLWNQTGGDWGRTGVAELLPGPWDIVSVFDALAPSEWIIRISGPGFVDTPYGVTGVARDRVTDACTFIRVLDAATGNVQRTPIPDLKACWLGGYSASQDLVLVCRAGVMRESGLTAYDARTFALKWSVAAGAIFGPDGQDVEGGSPAPSTEGDEGVGCQEGAIDDASGEFVAPWPTSRTGADYFRHRIASVDLATGRINWSVTVPIATLARVPIPGNLPWPDGAGPNYVPIASSLAAGGVLIYGLALCPDAVLCADPTRPDYFVPIRNVFAWLDRTGNPVGMYWSEGDPGEISNTGDQSRGFDHVNGGSAYAVSDGPVAYAVVGNKLLAIDPTAPQPRSVIPFNTVEGFPTETFGVRGPILDGDGMLVFLVSTVSKIDPRTGALLWGWNGFGQAPAGGEFASFLTTSGEVFWNMADLATCADNYPAEKATPNEAIACNRNVAILDASTGFLRQSLAYPGHIIPAYSEPVLRIPVAGGEVVSYPVAPWTVPTADGVLFGDALGRLVYVQPSDPARAPVVRLETAHPAPGAPFEIVLHRDDLPNATSAAVQWGGDKPETKAWPASAASLSFTHTFAQEGRQEVLVTITYSDRTTRTRVLDVDPGGVPGRGPPDAMAVPATATPYPGVGEDVTVTVARPEGQAVELFADWGDGALDRIPWGSSAHLALQHRYTMASDRDAVFTSVFLDGTTASRILKFEVGGAPPPGLSVMQEAFSPENQNTTFFLIGLAVTALGSAFGLLLRRRHRGRIHQQLREMDGIRQRSGSDPDRAMGDLLRLRRDFEGDLVSGRLQESQYQILHAHAERLLARLVPLILEQAEGLTASFRRRLEAVLVDGRVDDQEWTNLARLLERETGLAPEQHARLGAFLRDAPRAGPSARARGA